MNIFSIAKEDLEAHINGENTKIIKRILIDGVEATTYSRGEGVSDLLVIDGSGSEVILAM